MSLAGSLSIVILRRDRCVCRETTADSSAKPRLVVDSLIVVIEQDLLIFGQDTRVIEKGGREKGGGGGSLALAKLQIPALVLARYPSFMPKFNPKCKLLTGYVGRFYKATCVTPCILEVGGRTNSQYNQSHRVLVFS